MNIAVQNKEVIEIVQENKEPKVLNIYVESKNGNKKVNVNIPLLLIGWIPLPFNLSNDTAQTISSFVKNAKSGDILIEVNEEDGDYVKITVK